MEKEDVEVVVVSLDDYSWKVLIENKFYAFPRGTRKVGKYFAFYRKGEISHYAEVEKSEEVDKQEVGIGYWLHCMPDAEPPFQRVTFSKINKLKVPIKKDAGGGHGTHVQGRRYTTLKKLLKAKTISDLKGD